MVDPVQTTPSSALSRLLWSILSWTYGSLKSLLSRTFTVNLSVPAVIVLLLVVAVAVTITIRYRFHAGYRKLEPLSPNNESNVSFLHPNAAADREDGELWSKPYPDEFLSAFLSSIKVFGYLEQPVFHELARHLQTRKLLQGDTLFGCEDQERSFYIVVDGCVQVFVMRDSAAPLSPLRNDGCFQSLDDIDEESHGDWGGHTLLNEVRAGGTLSSLFTILSLFTEDVSLRHETEPLVDFIRAESVANTPAFEFPSQTFGETRQPASAFPATSVNWFGDVFAAGSLDVRSGERSAASNPSPRVGNEDVFPSLETPEAEADARYLDQVTGRKSGNSGRLAQNRFNTGESYERSKPTLPATQEPQKRRIGAVHTGIVARATVDTTLMVIPAEAFHRLTEKFPKAAAHIVQVILTRFQRVTFLTLYQYLGLTRELLQIEKTVNELATYRLPENFLDGGSMERMRQKFIGQIPMIPKPRSSKQEVAVKDAECVTIPQLLKRPSPSVTQGELRQRRRPAASVPAKIERQFEAEEAGKRRSLLSPPTFNVKNLPAGMRRHNRIGSGVTGIITGTEGIEEEMRTRDTVFECICRSIGLVQTTGPCSAASTTPSAVPANSPDGQPSRFPANDLFTHMIQQRALYGGVGFPNASRTDLESASTSSPTSSAVMPMEIANEVEIRYFEKGTYLVQERDRHVGLYFVIDGLLDVSIGGGVQSKSREGDPTNYRSGSSHLSAGSLSSRGTSSGRPAADRRCSTQKSRSNYPGKHASPGEPVTPASGMSSGSMRSSAPQKFLFHIKPGGLAGYLASLTGYPSFVNIVAATDSYVGYLSKRALDRIVDKHPMVLMTLAKRLISQLSPLVLHIDFALEWVQANAGQVIYRQNDLSDSIYIVLNGRLRTIMARKDDPNSFDIVAEYGQGDSVGELEVLIDAPRPSTLHAIRDTEIAKMPKTLFNALSLRRPEITLQISRMVALQSRDQQRVVNNSLNLPSSSAAANPSSFSTKFVNTNNNYNLKTVGMLPVNASVPIGEFAKRLKDALVGIGATVALLNHSAVLEAMGRHAFSKMGKLKLNSWLSEHEERARIVLYVADGGVNSVWTQKCIRQADAILLVGLGDGSPAIGEFERLVIGMQATARKELVLLHPERMCKPGSTHNWLKNRPWIRVHHHVQMQLKMPVLIRQEEIQKNPFLNLIEHVHGSIQVTAARFGFTKSASSPVYQGLRSDFARLARRLCGKSVGLVLGGGGARGLAHIGIIRALEEAGVPIDMVGGTSIGSLIGSLYARESDNLSIMGRAKQFSHRMSSKWRQALDLTYPAASWFTGREFNRTIWKLLGGNMIEDFWLPFFCVTTNITWSRLEIHQNGYAWRYVRASMSLSGYLPPLCDNGHMLVDGGYVDNLPVSVMRAMGADTIFAVDVASEEDTSPVDYGDALSGWWIILNRLNPFSSHKRIPTLADIQSRLTYVSSVKQLEEAKAMVGCLYFKPSVQMYGTLDFNRFVDIVAKGYEYGTEVLRKLQDQGVLQNCMGLEGATGMATGKHGLRGRRNSV